MMDCLTKEQRHKCMSANKGKGTKPEILDAGIGGFRMAMQNLGEKCVFSSEWDAQAQKNIFVELDMNNWSREETIIAFNVYCKIPFKDSSKVHLQIRLK